MGPDTKHLGNKFWYKSTPFEKKNWRHFFKIYYIVSSASLIVSETVNSYA